MSVTPLLRTLFAVLLGCLVGGAQSLDTFEALARQAEAQLDSNPLAAAKLLRQALSIRPAWAEGWLSLGAALYQADRPAEASDAFRKGVRLAPGLGAAWGFLGLCEARLGDAEQAITDIRHGEQLGLGGNPQFNLAVRLRAAQLLILESAFDEALAQMQPLLELHIDSPLIVHTMGLCALARPAAYETLPAEQRALVDAAGTAAWAAASRKAAEAGAAYAALLERYPQAPGVHYAHGLYLMETDREGALAEFRAEIAANPGHWPSRIVTASLLTRAGEPEQAIHAVSEALEMVPPRFRWLCHAELGHAYLDADRLDQAIPELESAVQGQRDNPQLHFQLSQAYRRAGRKAEAEREDAEFRRLKSVLDPLSLTGAKQ